MIYKLTFDYGRIDWCTAESELHLLKSYDKEFDLLLQDVESLEEISEEESKTIMVSNPEFDEEEHRNEISLYDLSVSDKFAVIASTEFD